VAALRIFTGSVRLRRSTITTSSGIMRATID
jgi:hypothetical protein